MVDRLIYTLVGATLGFCLAVIAIDMLGEVWL